MRFLDYWYAVPAPIAATRAAWAIWAISWALAAAWSRPTVGRPAGLRTNAHYIPVGIGAVLLLGRHWLEPLWGLPEAAGWLLFAVAVAGFAFAWWARLWLGSLWSGTITRKADHKVVDTGPYRLVRHPIYTGLILSGFALAGEIATPGALIGAVLMAVGWAMKARVEERFLTAELGRDYDVYRRRTPMLVPFAKPPG
jgi:protein-S-isoprenylcysteine O-methyltransferase Ste14